MNHDDLESFEKELCQLDPAAPPPALMQRLADPPCRRADDSEQIETAQGTVSGPLTWKWWLRWMAPVAATAIVVAGVWMRRTGEQPASVEEDTAAVDLWMPATVEVDRHLMAAFEGVARLPDGMPFRFRCYSWDEELVARDASGSVEIRQRAPRMEVVPINLAVY